MSQSIGANELLFKDDFKGPLNRANWDFNEFDKGGSFYGRTQQRQSLPEASNGVLHLQLDTFNPTGGPKFDSFLGSEAITTRSFGLKNGAGVAFEARAKFVGPTHGGIVGGFFTFAGTNSVHDEIDYEALSNDAVGNRNRIQTNVYAHEPLGKGHPAFKPISSPLTNYHTYRIEWLPDRVRWLVDGKLVREDKGPCAHRPGKGSFEHLGAGGRLAGRL
jgi:beta-glucanase (GH16 family)